MNRWDVDIAKHDADGAREHVSLGTFERDELPSVLADALRRATDSGAAVQVRRERPSMTAPVTAA
jgi:hypothetical protein